MTQRDTGESIRDTSRGLRVNIGRPLELLIVENYVPFLREAENVFMPLVDEGDINLTVAETLAEAEESLSERKYDGIISNAYFRTGFSGQTETAIVNGLEQELGAHYRALGEFTSNILEGWVQRITHPPSGIYLANRATELRTPIVLCTENANLPEFEPLYLWSRGQDSQIVNLADCFFAHRNKSWNVATSSLMAQLYNNLNSSNTYKHGWFAAPFLLDRRFR